MPGTCLTNSLWGHDSNLMRSWFKSYEVMIQILWGHDSNLMNRNWFSRRHLQIDWLVQEKDETPLLAHWSYVFLALTNQNIVPLLTNECEIWDVWWELQVWPIFYISAFVVGIPYWRACHNEPHYIMVHIREVQLCYCHVWTVPCSAYVCRRFRCTYSTWISNYIIPAASYTYPCDVITYLCLR